MIGTSQSWKNRASKTITKVRGESPRVTMSPRMGEKRRIIPWEGNVQSASPSLSRIVITNLMV